MRRTGRNKQKGITLLTAMIALVIMGFAFQQWFLKGVEDYKQEMYSLQAKRLADITNVLARYVSSPSDPTSGILAPHEQWDVSGAAFKDGAIHNGLDWLKSSDCSGGEAPIDLLDCDYNESPLVGDNQMYRFTISNDGTTVVPKLQLVDRTNTTLGLVIDGVIQPEIAAVIANRAEGRVAFTAMGAINTFFKVDRASAIISTEVGLNVSSTPYQRTDGSAPITGDEHFANGAGIVFDTAGDIKGAENISAERFSSYDRATNTISSDRYLEPDGTSSIENLKAAGGIETETITAKEAFLDELQTNYLEQLDPDVQNVIRGELRIGDETDYTTLGQGHMFTTGNIYDANNPDFMINLDGISRMEDIAIGAANEALLSNRLPNFVQKGALVAVANSSIPKPTCGTNGSPRLILVPLRWTSYFLDAGAITINDNINEFYADDTSTDWLTRMKTYSPKDISYIDDPQAAALANIYCYYP